MSVIAVYKEPNRFRAYVEVQIAPKKYKLLDIHNLDLDKPFRNHVWIETEATSPFQKGQTVEIEANVCLYKKASGKMRFGLVFVKFIRIVEDREDE